MFGCAVHHGGDAAGGEAVFGEIELRFSLVLSTVSAFFGAVRMRRVSVRSAIRRGWGTACNSGSRSLGLTCGTPAREQNVVGQPGPSAC